MRAVVGLLFISVCYSCVHDETVVSNAVTGLYRCQWVIVLRLSPDSSRTVHALEQVPKLKCACMTFFVCSLYLLYVQGRPKYSSTNTVARTLGP